MSEVDRLSNSGLYPILPLGDKRTPGNAGHPPNGNPREKQKPPDDDPLKPPPQSHSNDDPSSDPPRPPKSLIDEYA
jgi:hypothetical protein